MKRYMMMIPIVLSPLLFCMCAPPVEYHSVRVYEYGPRKVQPKVTHKSDDPRDFKPVQGF